MRRPPGAGRLIDGVSRKAKLLIEAPANGGRNYNGPKVAKFFCPGKLFRPARMQA